MRLSQRLRTGVVSGSLAVLLIGGFGGTAALADPQDQAAGGGLVVLSDFVQGGQNIPPGQAAQSDCVQSSRFARNSQIVFRARVLDGATGQELAGGDLSSVQATLGDGTVLDLHYGGHPGGGAPVTDHFWSAAWLVPQDYPTGTVNVSISATANDGRTGDWIPFNVAPSALIITSQVLPELAPPAPSK